MTPARLMLECRATFTGVQAGDVGHHAAHPSPTQCSRQPVWKMCMGHCLGARYGQQLTAAASSKTALSQLSVFMGHSHSRFSRQHLQLVLVRCILEHHFIALARCQNSCHCGALEGGGGTARGCYVYCLPGKAVCHACWVQHPEALHVVHLL